MFGLYRTVLALMVVALHVGGVPQVGGYAVFGFFVLSGYLMTLIMHRSYGYTVGGWWRYALNRALRIYPIYWVSLALSVVVIALSSRSIHDEMTIPNTIGDWAQNILLVLFPWDGPRLTPPAWALTVELFYYVLIGLGLSMTKRITWIWFALASAWHVAVAVLGLGYTMQYSAIPAAALPFAVGALIFHYKTALIEATKRVPSWGPLAIGVLTLANWYVGQILDAGRGVFFYTNFLLCVAMVIALLQRPLIAGLPMKLDAQLGDLSYPVYLMHYQVALAVITVASLVGIDLAPKSLTFLAIALPAILLVSWLVSTSMEKPIETLRTKLRPRATSP